MNIFPRADFPLINEPPYKPFCYADSAASTQIPHPVIEAMTQYARINHSNVHRAPYRLATNATELYEHARTRLAQYFGAESDCVVFTKNATEALNLLAAGLSEKMTAGDGVILSVAEHHSAIVPWQLAAQRRGLNLFFAGLDSQGQISLTEVERLCTEHPNIKGMVVIAASNSTGVIQPIKKLTTIAKNKHLWSIVDACQMGLDMGFGMDCGADYMVISAHKMFGPTGVGALIGKKEGLQALSEYQVGGGMIRSVTQKHFSMQDIPHRFEAGTPPLHAVAGWDAAIKYIEQFDRLYRIKWTEDLVAYGIKVFSELEGFKLIFADQKQRLPIFSLCHDYIHPHDIGTYLDHLHGIAARAGHHCTMPLMHYLGINATLRLSFSWYNTRQEIDYCAAALRQAQEFFNV